MSPLWRTVSPAAAFAAVVALLSYRAARLTGPVGVPDRTHWALEDFRDAIYYPVRAFLAGDNPYDTFDYIAKYPVDQIFPPYSPLTLALHAPFGLLPARAAEISYFVLTILLTVVMAWLALRICERRRDLAAVLTVSALVLLSRPGHWNLLVGQSTVQIVIGVYLALWYADDRPWIAGLGLALTTIKPTFGVPLALLMLAQRRWRTVSIAVGFGSLGTLAATGVLVASSGGIPAFARSLMTAYANFVAQQSVDPATSPVRLDALALVSRLSGGAASEAIDLMVTAGILALTAWLLWRVSAEPRDAGQRRAIVSLVCLALLTASYQQSYNALLLTMPLISLTGADFGAPADRHVRILLLLLLAVPAVNYVASFHVAARLVPYPGVRLLVSSINPVAVLTAYVLFYRRVASSLAADRAPARVSA